jgi:hypothetical protein
LNIAGVEHMSSGGHDIFVLELDAATGATIGWQSYGGNGTDTARSVATDASGNVYVAGNFEQTMTVGNELLTSQGAEDIFVFSTSGNGTVRWAASFGGNSADELWDLTLDDQEDVYLCGSFTGSIDLGGGSVTAAGAEDLFLLKLEQN